MPDSGIANELLAFFESHGLRVAVGLKPGGGIVIRSQDERVDADNIETVKPQEERGVYVTNIRCPNCNGEPRITCPACGYGE